VRGSVERSASVEFSELYRCDSSALRSCVVLVPVWRSCGCAGSIGCTVRHAIHRAACTRARGRCRVGRRVAQRRWRSRGRRGEAERSAPKPQACGSNRSACEMPRPLGGVLQDARSGRAGPLGHGQNDGSGRTISRRDWIVDLSWGSCA